MCCEQMASKSELLEIIHRASMSSSEVPATGLEFATAMKLGLCLATELGELHRRGEFHGRLSPQAIHLVAQRAEWIDWHDVAEPHESFVAPEFTDDTISGAELDVFGYGATMAALLLGRRPTYSEAGDIEVYGRGIDVGLANVFDAATAPDRLDRFESMDDVIAELTRLAQRAGLGASIATAPDMSGDSGVRQFPLPKAARTLSSIRRPGAERIAPAFAAAAVAAVATRRRMGNVASAFSGAVGSVAETARGWSAQRRPVRHEQDNRRRQAWVGLAVVGTLALAVMIVRTADSNVGDFSQLAKGAAGGNAASGAEIEVVDPDYLDGETESTLVRAPTWPTNPTTPATPTTVAPNPGQVGVRSPLPPTNPGTAGAPRPTSGPPPASVPRQPPVPTTATRSAPTQPPVPRSSVPPPVSPNPRIVNPAPSTTATRVNPPPPTLPAPTNAPAPANPPTNPPVPRRTSPPPATTTPPPPTTLPAPPPPVTVDALKPPPPGVPTTVDAVAHWSGPPTTVDAVRRP
jgi:hypothetical protein